MRKMSDADVLAAIKSNSPLGKARMVFSDAFTRIQHAKLLKETPPIEMRRMEFDAIRQIAAALGVMIDDDGRAKLPTGNTKIP